MDIHNTWPGISLHGHTSTLLLALHKSLGTRLPSYHLPFYLFCNKFTIILYVPHKLCYMYVYWSSPPICGWHKWSQTVKSLASITRSRKIEDAETSQFLTYTTRNTQNQSSFWLPHHVKCHIFRTLYPWSLGNQGPGTQRLRVLSWGQYFQCIVSTYKTYGVWAGNICTGCL